jgi:fructose-1,6-bisphosphatase I
MLERPLSLRALLEQQRRAGKCESELTDIIFDLVSAAKIISHDVNRAGLTDILGIAGTTNVHGETVQKLDVYANELFVSTLRQTGSACGLASEESEHIIAPSESGQSSDYVVFFDPLDGSSNIDVNVSIGTIFSIYRRISPSGPATLEDFLRRGVEQVAAGYFIYGSSTMLVYTVGNGVAGFTLDPPTGQFLVSHPDIRIPARGKIYSCNEGNACKWDEPTRLYVNSLKIKDTASGRPYSARYVGSLVADFHRNLLKGGIFLYPADYSDPSKPPTGKLRLMYEANPMAFVVEQAGGTATDGARRIMEIEPTDIHHRVPLVIGSKDDVADYLRLRQGL